MHACCFSEYGAPEEGELKRQQPFTLKNQLLSKSFEINILYIFAFKIQLLQKDCF